MTPQRPEGDRARAERADFGRHDLQANERLRGLSEISKLLTSFEGVDATVPAAISVMKRAIPACSVILILETNGDRARTIISPADDGTTERLERAKAHAQRSYAYLTGAGRGAPTAPTKGLERSDRSARPGFILLPLALAQRPILGALQIERQARFDEMDLLFVDSVVSQLAVAIDRHATAERKHAAAEAGRRSAKEEQAEAERKKDAALAEKAVEQRGRAAADALRAQYEALVDNLDAAFVWEVDGLTLRVTYVSRRVEAVLGYPRDRWLREPGFWSTCVDPVDRRVLEDTFSKARLEKKDQRCDHRCSTVDGRVVRLHTRVHLAQADARAPVFYVMSVDMTEPNEGQERIREQLEFTRLVTGSLHEGVVAVDLERRVTFFNPAAERMLACPEESALGSPIRDILAIERADGTLLTSEEEPFVVAMRTGEPARNDDQRFVARGREAFPASYSSAALRRNGQPSGAVLTFDDITERKRVEGSLRQATRAREELLAVVSHDLEGPLSLILMNLTVMMRSLGDRDAGKAFLGALAGSWRMRPPGEVLDQYVELLTRALELDVAFVQIDESGAAVRLASSYVGTAAGSPDVTRKLAVMLTTLYSRAVAAPLETIHTGVIGHPVSGDTLRVAVLRLPGGGGAVAAASRRTSFPDGDEIAVLVSAIHQLAQWRRVSDLEHAAARAELQLAERSITPPQLEDENANPRDEVAEALSFRGIVGESPPLRDLLAEIELLAPTDVAVLLFGESGTGKELFARAIHERSRRASHPLIAVNCSAIPHEMFESEFFGHVRGAFTGAHRDRPGRFKLADRGTLFLDEVGEIPLDLQPKLLRVLQEGQFESVGGDTTHTVNVRVIAASNRSLSAAVKAGTFREDLYYRLHVFPLRVPALRDRQQDIPLLANHFIEQVAKHVGKPHLPRLSESQLVLLARYDWPGNVRELKNVIERAVILGRGGELWLEEVIGDRGRRRTGASASSESWDAFGPGTAGADGANTSAVSPPLLPPDPRPQDVVPADEWRRREHANLLAALARSSGRIYGPGGAAQLLGVKPSTLRSRLRALGIRARERGPV